MRLLLVEDDEVIGERVAAGLRRAGYEVEWAEDGERGLSLALAEHFDGVLLDLMLPRMDGWTVCARLRAARRTLPILMLTARDSVPDRIRGLDAGADDYLPKPFDFGELLARVRALLRRDKVHKTRHLTVGDLAIDTAARSVERGGRALALTRREYDLLEHLALNEGRTVSRETILEVVWRDDTSLSDTISFHVKELRKKVDADFDEKLIHTVHGVGYVLRATGGAR